METYREPMTREERVRRLAAAFSHNLWEELGEDAVKEIAKLATDLNLPNDCCPSHDYCDGNQMMYNAFTEIFGYEPTALDGDKAAVEEESGYWSEAWALAMSRGYDAARIMAESPQDAPQE